MDSNNKREQWKQAEKLTKAYLESKWYKIIGQNFCIRWGEIDIIWEKWNIRVFVEVKAVEQTQDLHNYITAKKIATLLRTIDFFNLRNYTDKLLRLDVVFVKDNDIIHHYENVTNN